MFCIVKILLLPSSFFSSKEFHSTKQVNGERIEPGDNVKAIDGKEVTASDITSRLRGSDIPGTKVKLTIIKGGGPQAAAASARSKTSRELEFTLTRADMRSVMNVKVSALNHVPDRVTLSCVCFFFCCDADYEWGEQDLYMALGELNSASRNPTAEELLPLVQASFFLFIFLSRLVKLKTKQVAHVYTRSP